MKVTFHTLFVSVMLLALHHYQVIRRVVRAVAIFVMNHLVRAKRATKHLFSNDAVLIEIGFAAPTDNAIAASSNMATFPMPMIGAI